MTWNSRTLLVLVGYEALLSLLLRLAQVKKQIKKNSDVPSLVQFCTDTCRTFFEIENILILDLCLCKVYKAKFSQG